MRFGFAYGTRLVAAIVVSATASPALGAQAQATHLGSATYDPARGMLVVPYEGPEPTFVHESLNPLRHYFDFRGASLAKGGLQTMHPGGGIARVAIAERPDQPAVRVAFTLTRVATPTIRLDPSAHLIMIWPLGPAKLTARPLPLPKGHPAGAAPMRSPSPSPAATVDALPFPSLPPVPQPPVPSLPRPPVLPTPLPARPSPALTRPLPIVTPTPLPEPSPHRMVFTHFGVPRFDGRRQALVMPYQGALPGYAVQSGVGSLTIDFPRSAIDLVGGEMSGGVFLGLITHWHAQDFPAEGRVRVRLELPGRGEVLVADDAAHGELLLVAEPDGRPATGTARAAVSTTFGRAYAEGRALALPYKGRMPSYVVERAADQAVFIDFMASGLEPSGVQLASATERAPMPFWLLARRPGLDVVRVMLTPASATDPRVVDDKAHQRLLILPGR